MAGKENREIKNSVFVDLFYEDESAEANEIALFNAIHDEPLPEGTKIRRFRVDNTIYMNFQNDISFDAGGKVIVFGEHQFTVNENMPLRGLQKTCALIQKKLEKGKTISEIADDLEDTEENIAHLIEEFHLGRKES